MKQQIIQSNKNKKQTKITDYYKKITDYYKKKIEQNKCIMCNVNLGYCNPRQLCGKIFCYEQKI